MGYELDPGGGVRSKSLCAGLLTPSAGWQYARTMYSALLAPALVIGGVGAFYALSHRHQDFAKLSLKMAVIAGGILALTQAFPTGDLNSGNVVRYQPTK